MTYVTRCKKGHQLYVLSARVSFKDTPVMADGFEMMPTDSEDEVVSCNVSGCYTGTLEQVGEGE